MNPGASNSQVDAFAGREAESTKFWPLLEQGWSAQLGLKVQRDCYSARGNQPGRATLLLLHATSFTHEFFPLAEGEGFEPPVRLLPRLISSQVLSTTQPPFQLTQW